MQKAIDKLQSEMEGAKSNAYIKVIGQYLIGHLEANPNDAAKLAAADKTIAKSLDAMKAEAKKVQSGGMAMLTDAEGFAIVLKYFGIECTPSLPCAVPSAPEVSIKKQPSTSFDVSLDDFL